MKQFYFSIFVCFLLFSADEVLAQVGIGTTAPDAQLDIRSTNQVTPANTDGILIPKVDAFPATNPTAAQQGMLIYLTTPATFSSTLRQPGFYYWNDPTDWIGISSTANGDHDWYEVGTTTAPDAITDDMFHTGNVAIGKNTASSALDVSSGGAASSGIINALNSTVTAGGATIKSAINNFIQGNSDDVMMAQANSVSNSGTGIHYGVANQITSPNSSFIYGFNNVINSNSNTFGSNNFITNNSASNTTSVSAYSNNLAGSSAGTIKGYETSIGVTGNGNHYGNYNLLAGTGGGSNSHYGTYNWLTGTGITTKYGNYNLINTTAGGTHYGVYSEVLKPGATNFAGYFLGNVGIGTTVGNTYTLPPSRGTVGQTMRTDALGNVTWANNSDFAWSLSGNTVAAANFIGTTNAQPFRMYSNNVERMRINPTDGEVVINGTASPYAGDALVAIGTAALPFATNGYTGQAGSGVWGETLAASSSAFSSVQGYYGGTGAGAGVLGNYNGTNTGGIRSGVYGVCSTPAAANGGAGVYGYNAIASGNQRIGVLGNYNGASFGLGVVGVGFGGGIPAGNIDVGVVGWRTNNANYSGYFNGNHVIANGTKTASIGTSKGNQLLYVTELPEVWFEDVGGGQLVNGTTHIQLDPLFLETIFVDQTHPMRVFLQEEGESNGLIVIKDADNKGFTVKEKNGGTSNITFSFRIMAKRLHFQDHRFGNDPLWGGGDTRKYNQYATPPPVDYNENVRFQEQQKRNYKPTPMPEGFIDYFQLQEQTKKMEVAKPKK